MGLKGDIGPIGPQGVQGVPGESGGEIVDWSQPIHITNTTNEALKVDGGVVGPTWNIKGNGVSNVSLIPRPQFNDSIVENYGGYNNITLNKYEYGVRYGNKIYCIPHDASTILVIDTITNVSTDGFAGYSNTGSGKYKFGVLFNDKIYCIPYNEDNILVIDPVNETVDEVWAGYDDNQFRKYYSATIGSDNKIYCIPYEAPGILVIDPVGGIFTQNFGGYSGISGDGKYISGVLAGDDKIYCYPFNTNEILVIDPIGGTATTGFGGYVEPISFGYTMGVLAEDGKIYGIPLAATQVLVIDPVAGTATPSFGGVTLPSGDKYRVGLLFDGKIYCAPNNISYIMMIDTVAGTIDTQYGTYSSGVVLKYYDMSIGIDNKIYCIPFRAADILVIDPVAGATISGYGGYNNTDSAKFQHSVVIDDAVYGIPYGGTGVLKVSTGFDAILLDGRTDINGDLNVGGEISNSTGKVQIVSDLGVDGSLSLQTIINNDKNTAPIITEPSLRLSTDSFLPLTNQSAQGPGGWKTILNTGLFKRGVNSRFDSGWYCALTTDNDNVPNEYFLLSDSGKISNSTGKVQIVNDLDVNGRIFNSTGQVYIDDELIQTNVDLNFYQFLTGADKYYNRVHLANDGSSYIDSSGSINFRPKNVPPGGTGAIIVPTANRAVNVFGALNVSEGAIVDGDLQVNNSIKYTSGFNITTYDQGGGIYRNILQTNGDDADTLELRGGNWDAGNGLVKLGDNVEIDNDLAVAGNITYAGTIGQSSSLRYKENIVDFDEDYNKILELEVKKYTKKDTGKTDFGVIAEEVDELGLKHLVVYDEENRPDAVNYSKISLYLLEVVKDLKKEIETLKNKNN
eukprot:Awhi_evm4s11834